MPMATAGHDHILAQASPEGLVALAATGFCGPAEPEVFVEMEVSVEAVMRCINAPLFTERVELQTSLRRPASEWKTVSPVNTNTVSV